MKTREEEKFSFVYLKYIFVNRGREEVIFFERDIRMESTISFIGIYFERCVAERYYLSTRNDLTLLICAFEIKSKNLWSI